MLWAIAKPMFTYVTLGNIYSVDQIIKVMPF